MAFSLSSGGMWMLLQPWLRKSWCAFKHEPSGIAEERDTPGRGDALRCSPWATAARLSRRRLPQPLRGGVVVVAVAGAVNRAAGSSAYRGWRAVSVSRVWSICSSASFGSGWLGARRRCWMLRRILQTFVGHNPWSPRRAGTARRYPCGSAGTFEFAEQAHEDRPASSGAGSSGSHASR
jgi:hypothetical protein